MITTYFDFTILKAGETQLLHEHFNPESLIWPSFVLHLIFGQIIFWSLIEKSQLLLIQSNSSTKMEVPEKQWNQRQIPQLFTFSKVFFLFMTDDIFTPEKSSPTASTLVPEILSFINLIFFLILLYVMHTLLLLISLF